MRTRSASIAAGIIAIALCLVPSVAASAAPYSVSAVSSTGSVTPNPQGEYTATLNGVEFGGSVSALAAAPGCSASDPATKRVNTWQRRNPSGVAKLECGNSSYGWRHIAAGKAQDWQNIINKYNLGTDWATFAKWNIGNTVGAPASAPYNSANQTYTYQAPLQIRNAQGQVVRTYTVKVPVGSTTERIITAFPS